MKEKIGDYAKSIVYGGMDGIVTTFAVVAGAVGGNLGITPIVILGFSIFWLMAFQWQSEII
mgnify:CR=1 FL=1